MDQRTSFVAETYTPNLCEAFDSEKSNGHLQNTLQGLRREIIGGLLYTHSRANSNTNHLLEATSFL